MFHTLLRVCILVVPQKSTVVWFDATPNLGNFDQVRRVFGLYPQLWHATLSYVHGPLVIHTFSTPKVATVMTNSLCVMTHFATIFLTMCGCHPNMLYVYAHCSGFVLQTSVHTWTVTGFVWHCNDFSKTFFSYFWI